MSELDHLVRSTISKSKDSQTASNADVARVDVLRAIAELKTQIVWYMLAFSVGQVALIVGLLRALH